MCKRLIIHHFSVNGKYFCKKNAFLMFFCIFIHRGRSFLVYLARISSLAFLLYKTVFYFISSTFCKALLKVQHVQIKARTEDLKRQQQEFRIQ